MSVTVLDAALGGGEDDTFAGRSTLASAWVRLRRDRVAMISVAVLVALVVIAVAAPLIAQAVGWTPTQQDRTHGLTPDGLPMAPSARHLLGTDNLGRDILVRTVYGARVSLLVGVVATGLATIIGVVVGVLAGYSSGAVDTGLSRLMDVVLSFPFLLFAIALVSIVGPGLSISVVVITFFSWAGIGRVVRGQTLSLKHREYVDAARVGGSGAWRILTRDILPGVAGPVIAYTTLIIPGMIATEAALSYLGVGVRPPTPSWGQMLSTATTWFRADPMYVLVPGGLLFATLLAFVLVANGVRRVLDPRQRTEVLR